MARDFFDELSDTIAKTTKDISKKAGKLYETQKIRSKIASEEQIVEKLKSDIGNVIYERYKDGEQTEDALSRFCEEIHQHMQIIAGYRDAAANLKGQKICPACGKSVDRSVVFCPFCGSPCPTGEPEKEKDDTQMETVCEDAVENEDTVESENKAEAAENAEVKTAETESTAENGAAGDITEDGPENEDELNLQEKEDAVAEAEEAEAEEEKPAE